MEYVKDSYTRNGVEITGTWIPDNDLSKYSPITQAYGISFNGKSEILVCRQIKDSRWQIPGGHPEEGESLEISLARELEEETDIKIKNIKALGVVKVEYPNNPDKTEGEIFYQSRFICDLDELSPQTPDPANGNVWERVFVPAEKVTEYVKWGKVGEAMFSDAIKLWRAAND